MDTRRPPSAASKAWLALLQSPHLVARAQEVKHYRFAYDQPKTTGYGILGDIFGDKLKELSKGTMLIDQHSGAQLGQAPQVLQLVKIRRHRVLHLVVGQCSDAVAAGRRDVAALPVPLGRSPDQGDGRCEGSLDACKTMIAETVQGCRIIALSTLGLRNMYSKRDQEDRRPSKA